MKSKLFLLSVLLVTVGCVNGASPLRDPLSAGSVQMLLEKNKTTKLEILEAFGGPTVVEGNADGNETWVYERMAYETRSADTGGAAAGGGFGGSGGGGGLIWGRAGSKVSSSRTTTLFVYFQNDVIADYKYRTTTY